MINNFFLSIFNKMSSLQNARRLGSETVKSGEGGYSIRKRWKLSNAGAASKAFVPGGYMQWGSVVYSDDPNLHLTLPTQEQLVATDDGMYDIKVMVYAQEADANAGVREIGVYIDNTNQSAGLDARFQYPHTSGGARYNVYHCSGRVYLRAGQTIGVYLSGTATAGSSPTVVADVDNTIDIALYA